MLKHPHVGPLKVALLSISPHNRAILEFFFNGAGRNLFKVTRIEEADALIVDYDHVGAREEWEQHANNNKPGIILSVHAVNLPNTLWIPKPLTSKALTEAASQTAELLQKSQPQNTAVPKNPIEAAPESVHKAQPLFGKDFPQPFGISSRPSTNKLRSLIMDLEEDDEPAPVLPELSTTTEPLVFDPAESTISMEEIARPIEPSIPAEIAERRWRDLCGANDDLQGTAAWQLEPLLFTPENYLLSNVQEGVKLAQKANQPVKVTLTPQHFLLLQPDIHHVYCTLDTKSDEFAMLCNNPIQTGQGTLKMPDGAEFATIKEQIALYPEKTLDIEAFLWVISLLTSQGRLNRNLDLNQRFALKHWPNMTRLEQFPQLMRIAALWSQRPGTVLDIAKALDIPQRYVISFYNAASTLNLFEMDQTKLKSREKEKPKESRGLFSRLLKRLLGGGSK